MKNIERPLYLAQLISWLNKNLIIVLIGQRRVGKSCLLNQLRDYLRGKSGANVLYISMELHEFKDIKCSDDLYGIVRNTFKEGGENYLLIDEVQDIADFEIALRELHSEGLCQIVITGSNANLFSSEISTKLAGRYIEQHIYCLTYGEFLQFHALEDSGESLLKYLKVGGLPGLSLFDIGEEAQVREYLQGVYNTVMMKDVVSRQEIRNVSLIENLAKFCADNVGKMLSVRNIANTLSSQGVKTSEMVIGSYVKHLCDGLIMSAVKRYDIHGKRLFEQNAKYYFADHGLRNMLCGFGLRASIDKVIENVIWNHLLVCGYEVTVGVLRSAEVDFIASKDGKKIYIQATYLLSSEDTIRREFGNLMFIKDNYPKYVISMDPVDGDLPEYPGITHLSLRAFLRMAL